MSATTSLRSDSTSLNEGNEGLDCAQKEVESGIAGHIPTHNRTLELPQTAHGTADGAVPSVTPMDTIPESFDSTRAFDDMAPVTQNSMEGGSEAKRDKGAGKHLLSPPPDEHESAQTPLSSPSPHQHRRRTSNASSTETPSSHHWAHYEHETRNHNLPIGRRSSADMSGAHKHHPSEHHHENENESAHHHHIENHHHHHHHQDGDGHHDNNRNPKHPHDDMHRRLAHAGDGLIGAGKVGKRHTGDHSASQRSVMSHQSDRSSRPGSPARTPIHVPDSQAHESGIYVQRTPREDKEDVFEEKDDEEERVFGNDVLGVVEVIDGEVHQRRDDDDDEQSDYGDAMHTARMREKAWACLPCCRGTEEDAELPDPNCCGCSVDGAVRRLFMRVAVDKYAERLWLANSIAHNVLLLVDQHEVTFTSPEWTAAVFMGVYLLELVIKGTAWGLWGGRYAYLSYDIFNRIDFVVTISSIVEYVALIYGKPYSLRGFRLLRLLRPLLKTDVFQDIGSILTTLEIGAVALFTVIYLMLFVFVLFGVVGMSAYSSSFERRCVWADSMEIKQPEQWCKRFDDVAPGLGLHSSCGPLQLCLSVGDPGFGFTHFNHMGAAMLSIFQAFSTDGQYAIMWATLQAEPAYAPITLIYWMSIGFVLGQILVNVFLAVLASVFTRVREDMAPDDAASDTDKASDAGSASPVPAASRQVSQSLTKSPAPTHPRTPSSTAASPVDRRSISRTSSRDSPQHHNPLASIRPSPQPPKSIAQVVTAGAQFGNSGETMRGGGLASIRQRVASVGEEAEEVPPRTTSSSQGVNRTPSAPDRVRSPTPAGLAPRSVRSPASLPPQTARHSHGDVSGDLTPVPVEAAKTPLPYLPSPRGDKEDSERTSFGDRLSVVFRSKPFEVIVLLAILGNSAVLAMVGAVEGIEAELALAELVFSIFFTAELAIQVLCDGSLSKYFDSGEHIFDFVSVAPTFVKLMTQLAGARDDSKVVSVLSALGIVRLLRASKYFFLRPLWLMLIKAASSWVPAFNLVLFIMVFMSAWTILGRVLFQDKLVNPRANFDTFTSGILTLFQVFTGDSWTAVMYDGMKASCADVGEYDAACMTNGGYCTDCEALMTVSYAWYYILFFWMGQYVFVTMFLALILEKFSVHEFMTIGSTNIQDIHLTRSEAMEAVAEYQKIPLVLVSERLVNAAFTLHVANPRLPSSTISKLTLIKFVKKKKPRRLWRLANWLGLVLLRRWLRVNVFCCFSFLKCCRPWPGDPDWGKVAALEDEEPEVDAAELERQFAERMSHRIRESMVRLVQTGMAGEVRMVSERLGIAADVSADLVSTPPVVALRLLKDRAILQRLGHNDLEGLFASDLVAEKQIEMAKRVAKHRASAEDDLPPIDEDEGQLDAMDQMVMEELAERRKGFGTINVMRMTEGALRTLSTNPVFDVVVYSAIIVSSIFLAMETPAEEISGPLPRSVSEFSNFLFTGVFLVEAVAKITAFGFFMPNDVEYEAYWQDGWNRLDFIVLLFSVADLAGLGAFVGSNTARIIRVSRALRPLRLMGRNKGMKTIISALIGSTKPIMYATLFLFMITTVFAVLGMALFKDSFGSCNDDSLDGSIGEGKFECLGLLHRPDTMLSPRVWSVPNSSFDTFPKAIQTLCRVFTLKWVSVWYLAMDSSGPGIQPVENINVATGSIFFVLFIFVGSFFSLNLFVSFIVDGFYAAQGVDSQFDEIQYASIQKLMFQHWPKRYIRAPMNIVSLLCRGLVMSVWFRLFSGLCLLANIVCMTFAHEGASADFEHFLRVQNDVFFIIFCVEILLTIVAWGPRLFLADGGYVFDLFLVFATLLTIIFAGTFRGASQGVRVLRLVRFFRMMQSNAIVESVFETVLLSLKQVANVLVVIFLVMSVFAVVGVSSYGTTKFGSRLSTQANFKSYPWAMMTLFQIMFGEEWHMLMDDCLVQPPYCTQRFVDPDTGEELSYGDCGSAFAWLYFLAFIVICNFTMINLFVGMIINNFSFCSNKETNGVVTPAHVEFLSVTWVNKFDEHATSFIPLPRVYSLMRELGEPLGFYGTAGNLGRYLCIREELKLVVEESEAKDAPRTGGERVLAWLRAMETRMEKELYEEWRIMQEEAASWEVEQMNKAQAKDDDDEGEGREGEGEGGRREDEDDREIKFDMPVVEDDDDDDDEMIDPDRAKRRKAAKARHKGGGRGKSTARAAGSRFGGGEERESVHVAGESMGRRRGGRGRGGSEETDGRTAAQVRAMEEEEEVAAKWERVEQVKQMHKPRKTLGMYAVMLCRWAVAATLVSKQRTFHRPAGQLRYDEVVDALLYWNKKESIVPKRIAEERKERDGDIVENVAAQIIHAFVKGAAWRRRQKRLNETKHKMRLLGRMGRINTAKNMDKDEEEEQDPVERMEEEQASMEARAKELLQSGDCEEGATKDVLATLVAERLVSYADLKMAAAEVGVEVSGCDGVFGLEEIDLEPLLSHPAVSRPVMDLRAREDIQLLLGSGYGALLREAAEEQGQPLPALGQERWEDLELGLLKRLLAVEKVKVRVAILKAVPQQASVVQSVKGPAGAGGGGGKRGSMSMVASVVAGKEAEAAAAEAAALKGQVERERREKAELGRVLEETQRRYQEARRGEGEARGRFEEEKTARESLQAKYDIAMAHAAAKAAAAAVSGRLAATLNLKRAGRAVAETPAVSGGGWRRRKEDDPWGMLQAQEETAVPASAGHGTSPESREDAGREGADTPISLPGQVVVDEGTGPGSSQPAEAQRPKTTGGMAEGGGRRREEAGLESVVGVKTSKEREVELQDALLVHKAERERLERMLHKVQAEKRAEKNAVLFDAAGGQNPPNQRWKKMSAFDPETTASLSTAAAMGFDVLAKKPAANTSTKKSKQPAWL